MSALSPYVSIIYLCRHYLYRYIFGLLLGAICWYYNHDVIAYDDIFYEVIAYEVIAYEVIAYAVMVQLLSDSYRNSMLVMPHGNVMKCYTYLQHC